MKKLLFMFPLFSLGLWGCSHQVDQPPTPDEKIKTISEIIHKMPHDGMKQVQKLVPDLAPVKDIAKDAPENLSAGMSKEKWLYSPELDHTIVVCEMLNTPAYLFPGQTLSPDKLESAKETMQEMMKMMDGDMKMMDGEMKEMMNEEPDKDLDEELDREEQAGERNLDLAKFEDYSPEKFTEIYGSRKFALFFHADWCPLCRALEKDLRQNLSSLPENSVILQVNYDTETKLKAQYKVRTQTTVVFFDKQGKILSTEINPGLEKFKKYLAT